MRARQSRGVAANSLRHRSANCVAAERRYACSEPIEREVRAIGRDVDRLAPRCRRGRAGSPLPLPHVAQVEVRRNHRRVDFDRGLKPPRGLGPVVLLHRLHAELVLEEREDRLRLRLVGRPGQMREPLPRDVRLLPLVLIFLQLLQVEERRLVFGSSFSTSVNAAAARSTNPPRR